MDATEAKSLIQSLKAKSDNSKAAGQPYNHSHWGNGYGVLITCNQADKIIELLIELSQQPTLQSDSVDAKELYVADVVLDKWIGEMYLEFKSGESGATMAANLGERIEKYFAGLSSKVNVNEKMKEALISAKNHIKLEADSETLAISEIKTLRKIDSALSTAPDDGWIDFDKQKPDIGKAVLVLLKKSRVITIGYLQNKEQKKICQLYGPIEDICDIVNDEVEKWQPLPSPPKV